jgi:hypothetical protein
MASGGANAARPTETAAATAKIAFPNMTLSSSQSTHWSSLNEGSVVGIGAQLCEGGHEA